MLLVLADRVHTLDRASAPAQALLVRRGRIIAGGSRDALRREAPGAAVLDLRGTTLTPGLTDSHLHLLEWAVSRREVDLARARTPEACADALAGRRAGSGGAGAGGVGDAAGAGDRPAAGRGFPGGWLLGRGWNPHHWGGGYPDRLVLDAAVADRPVALQSHDMHALWVNTRALEACGIGADTPDPEGGRIVRDARGAPTGVLLEAAAQLVTRTVPAPAPAEARSLVLDAQAALHRLGITGVHSFPNIHLTGPEPLALLEALRAEDLLRLRVLQQLPLERLDDALRLGLRSGFGGEWLRVGGVKMFLDGALGSRTAWLREPYEGTASERGIRVLAPEEFEAAVARAVAGGLATTVHAIGDAAVELALDVLARVGGSGLALPHRIEHVQLCPPERFGDAARAGIVCSMQPAHLCTDWRAADRHWGEARCRGAYAFGSLARAGATLAFGSDAPVEPVDPRLGFLGATARQDAEGGPAGGWHPEERIGMAETLAGYTRGAARAAGLQVTRGHLAAGADADFAAWDRDPLEAAGAELLSLRCVAAVVGGVVVWNERG